MRWGKIAYKGRRVKNYSKADQSDLFFFLIKNMATMDRDRGRERHRGEGDRETETETDRERDRQRQTERKREIHIKKIRVIQKFTIEWPRNC